MADCFGVGGGSCLEGDTFRMRELVAHQLAE